MKLEIKTEKHMSGHLRIFHTNIELINHLVMDFVPNIGTRAEKVKKVGVPMVDLIMEILSIENVTRISIQPYLVKVQIDLKPSSPWNEDIDHIVECMCLEKVNKFFSRPKKHITIKPGLRKQDKVYKMSWKFSEVDGETFSRPLTQRDLDTLAEASVLKSILIQLLFNINGVTGLVVYPNSVQVTRAKLFDWAEVELRVRQVFTAVFGNDIEFTRE